MLFDDSRKLKRGLKDLSPLFAGSQQSEAQNSPSYAPPEEIEAGPRSFQCLSVYNTDAEAVKPLAYFACQMHAEGSPSSIVSITTEDKKAEVRGLPVPRLVLAPEDLENLSKGSLVNRHAGNAGPQHFFIDFSYENKLVFEKAIPLLDKWILIIKPVLESLTEAYRMIKAASMLNPSLEYYLVFDMPHDHIKSSLLFERFSEIASRRLGVSTEWIGYFHASKEIKPLFQDIAWHALCSEPFENTRMIEKRGLMELFLAEDKKGRKLG